jgi:hypothetical protein
MERNTMGLRRSDSIIIRLERAGGSLTEASSLLAQAGADAIPLNNALRNVNIMVGDLRRAVVRTQNGDDLTDITNDLEAAWTKLWPLGGRHS